MENPPRDALVGFIRKYGTSLTRDPVRCEGLLRDTCPEYEKEVFVLVSALRVKIPADLIASHGQTSQEILFPLLTHRLQERCAFNNESASWAVHSWAIALGLADNIRSSESPGVPAKKGEKLHPTIHEKIGADIRESEAILASHDIPGKLTFVGSLKDDSDPGETGIRIRALGNHNWQIRYSAFSALYERGNSATEQILTALNEPGLPDEVRWRLILLLGKPGNREVVQTLENILKEPETPRPIFHAAIWALGETGDFHAGEILLPLLAEGDYETRQEAEIAIKKTSE